jgi:hypothetical protein
VSLLSSVLGLYSGVLYIVIVIIVVAAIQNDNLFDTLYISESRLLYVYTTAPQAFFLILALRFQHSSSSTETDLSVLQPLLRRRLSRNRRLAGRRLSACQSVSFESKADVGNASPPPAMPLPFPLPLL